MRTIFGSKLFWTGFSISSMLCAAIAYYYFPQANPIIHLDLTMNRIEAIDQAKELSSKLAIGPNDPSSAASFSVDEQVKNFVELEAGGKEALVNMMKDKLYEPYGWMIRLFKPFDQHQLIVKFTPNGMPYGFQETLSENSLLPNLSELEAVSLAESFAQKAPWNITLADYKQVDSSQEKRASGRLDHFFTYERIKEKIGDGFYRLKLVVSGNRVSELSHSVRVPEKFTQKYMLMRSANSNIAYAANLLMILLYILGCTFIGLVLLFKDRFVIWPPALCAALFVAGIVALNIPNQLPLAWMYYNTAHSPVGFLLQQAISVLYTFIFMSCALTLIFMAAESLGRRAFKHHMQFWPILSTEYASTYTVLGYGISGYLLMPLMLCYTVLFYLFTKQYLGWWSPSSALYNPNILATYFPWLESISVSLQAGFMEECLFRAIPLASAALIGERFGKKRWWLFFTFILQALIFGAAHANYPAQPAYARLVELFADSALFGAVYLAFGLLPVVITHFVYDVFWFALPIFISTAQGAMLNKAIIIALASAPLIAIMFARIKQGQWHKATADMLNSGWKPTEYKPHAPSSEAQTQITKISNSSRTIFAFVLLFGLGSWLYFSNFSNPLPRFTTHRSEIENQAKKILGEHIKKESVENWTALTFASPDFNLQPNGPLQHRFIWQEGNKNIYYELIGEYLKTPYWVTRFVKFAGPMVERSEEHHLYFRPNGALFRYTHKLPESFKGASIDKEQARRLATQTIETTYNLQPKDFFEISAVSEKQPERLDWLLTYSSSKDYPLSQGQARIEVKIGGDHITDVQRYVHVPEDWERQEDNRMLFAGIIQQICKLLIYIISLFGAAFAMLSLGRQNLFVSLKLFIILSIIFLFEFFNSWPVIIANFNTSQPFYDQLFRALPISATFLLIRAAALSLMFSLVSFGNRTFQISKFSSVLLLGVSLGALIAGSDAILHYLIPSMEPAWPNLTPMRFLLPLTTGINTAFLNYFSLTILLLLCTTCVNALTKHGRTRILAGLGFSALIGFISAGLLYADNLQLLFYATALFAIYYIFSYYCAIRFDAAIIPIAMASFLILQQAKEALYNGYQMAIPASILGSIAIALAAIFWSKIIHKKA